MARKQVSRLRIPCHRSVTHVDHGLLDMRVPSWGTGFLSAWERLVEIIDFPSNDGFHVKIDVAVEWRVNADKVAEVFTRLGNIKEIEAKVVIPNTRSIARVEASKYNAKDFIQGEGRERFERVFFADLQRVCADKGVQILRGMVRKIQVPEEISKPIRDAEIAKQELLRCSPVSILKKANPPHRVRVPQHTCRRIGLCDPPKMGDHRVPIPRALMIAACRLATGARSPRLSPTAGSAASFGATPVRQAARTPVTPSSSTGAPSVPVSEASHPPRSGRVGTGPAPAVYHQ
jgi:hypothetical protein